MHCFKPLSLWKFLKAATGPHCTKLNLMMLKLSTPALRKMTSGRPRKPGADEARRACSQLPAGVTEMQLCMHILKVQLDAPCIVLTSEITCMRRVASASTFPGRFLGSLHPLWPWLPPSRVHTPLSSFTSQVAFPRVSRKWNHTAATCLGLASSTQLNYSEVPSHCFPCGEHPP